MKALSLKQPFAELVVSGRKTIEIRKWNTKFRGEFYIHASMQEYKNAMEKFGFNSLEKGAIIGKATLVEVKKYENDDEFVKDKNKHLATKDYGKYGFLLENPQRINPIKFKGKLGFWEF